MIPHHVPLNWKTFFMGGTLLMMGSFLVPAVGLSLTQAVGRVVGVTDGDTLVILRNGKQEKIRLYGVDCPEKKQDFGTQAKQFTSQMVYGQDVEIHIHSVDRYGRAVAEVILSDGRSLNKELVGSGYAWWYQHFAPHDEELKKLQQHAQLNKRGLWSLPHPVPPWEFRREKRGSRLAKSATQESKTIKNRQN